MDHRPAIDIIAGLVGAKTPGEAVEKVRAMIEGYPANEPPDSDRLVQIQAGGHIRSRYLARFQNCRPRRWFVDNEPFYGEVVRWWELPQ